VLAAAFLLTGPGGSLDGGTLRARAWAAAGFAVLHRVDVWRWALLGDPSAKAALDAPERVQAVLRRGDRIERR